MTNRETWLQSIRSNPSDWQAMLVFADWLEKEGDVLAAEQWRWIACVAVGLPPDGIAIRNLLGFWPNKCFIKPALSPRELANGANHNIRCMPTYPLTIEDVQAYLSGASK